MPHDIKTDEKLLHRLMRATSVSQDMLRRQRVSFIYGALPPDSTITRQQIESALARTEGESAA